MVTRLSRSVRRLLLVAVLCSTVAGDAFAQRGRGGGPPQPQRSPREAAHFDLTGYWMPLITEDWAERVAPPRKGEYRGVALSAAGRKVADAWDPAADLAAGNQCRAFGAAGLTRLPLRLHITWQDDSTLKVESDVGQQTRLLHFDAAKLSAAAEPSWQGQSLATWEKQRKQRGLGPAPSIGPGTLKVVTTRLRPGYLRRNGIPYSASATLTEYFHRHTDFGREFFTVLSVVEDPEYLTRAYITTTHFVREPDASRWAPASCETLTAP
jgi:hypothetical protein